MKPSIGRIVLVQVDPAENNGADTAPAVITRVWNDGMVNIRVMLDAFTLPRWMTSVKLVDDPPAEGESRPHTAWWPPRV